MKRQDIALCLDDASGSLAAARFGLPSEAGRGVEVAIQVLDGIPKKYLAADAGLAERVASVRDVALKLAADLDLVPPWSADLDMRCRSLGGALDEICSRLRASIPAPKNRPAAAMPRRQGKARVAPPDGLRTLREGAARLRCSIKTLNGHLASGALGYVVMGHGTKRPRKMLSDADIDQFIADQTRKDSPACPSIEHRVRRTGTSTSKSEVIAFTARRNARPGGKPKR
jgi:hypothetical protein